MTARLIITAILALGLSGCIDSMNGKSINLGEVSLGQQLIDLKAALDGGAVSADEYTTLKAQLISAVELCKSEDAGEGEDEGLF
jgi:hypothetical protein